MDVNELNFLFANITKQIKLCECAETFKKNAKDSADIKKNDTSKRDECNVCKTKIPAPEKDLILRMKSVFHKALQEIDIDLNSIPTDNLADDTDFNENSYYQVKCDLKYMKRNNKGETPLHSASGKKNLQSVITLLQNNANPNTQDNAAWTPLHEAVFKDDLAIASELLKAGAIVSVPGLEFTTPLHVSVSRRNMEMTRLLLKYGADLRSRDINGNTPEQFAETEEMKSLLKEYSNSDKSLESNKQFRKKIAPRQMAVFLTKASLLSTEERNTLENKLNLKFSNDLKEATHVVVEHLFNNVCEPNFQALEAILMGCAIVNVRWLRACLRKHRVVDFSIYEINGTTEFPCHNGPRLARNNYLEMNPPLFKDYNIYLKKMSNEGNIKTLVLLSGAKLLNREPNPEHSSTNNCMFHCEPGHAMECTSTLILYESGNREPALKYNMKHIKSLPVQWFLDCIQTFSIRDPDIN
ncbi:BRCA1-associated RING domain protein 1-like [Planococcus citri]|uniref:BRCA1-associated RING domain protein 1-like n=1 Tax=Planococcus citri TaxID=170843 RepID=UPI0031FA280E